MAVHSAFASQWSQQSGPFVVSLAMLAVLVLIFFADVLSPTNITPPESSLDESFDTDEVAVRTFLSPESSKGINVTVPTSVPGQVSTALNSSSGSGNVHAAKSETLLEESARDARTGLKLEKSQETINSGKDNQVLEHDSQVLDNLTSKNEGEGLGSSVPEEIGQSPGSHQIKESESGLRKETQSVSEVAAGGRKEALINKVEEGRAKVAIKAESGMTMEKQFIEEPEGNKGGEAGDGNGPEDKYQTLKAETQLSTENGSKNATEYGRSKFEPGISTKGGGTDTDSESKTVVQKASTSEAISQSDSDFGTGSGLESEKKTKSRIEEESKSETGTEVELEEEKRSQTIGEAELDQQNEAKAELDEKDPRSRTGTKSVAGSQPGSEILTVSGNWTRAQSGNNTESDVRLRKETEGGSQLVQNKAVAVSELVNNDGSFSETVAGNQADGEGTGFEAEEGTTSETSEASSASPENETPRFDENTETGKPGLLENKMPEGDKMKNKHSRSQTSVPRNFKSENLSSETSKAGTEASQIGAPDKQSVSNTQTDSKRSPELHSEAALGPDSSPASTDDGGPEVTPVVPGQELEHAPKTGLASDTGSSGPGKEAAIVGEHGDSIRSLDAGRAGGENGNQLESTTLPHGTTSEAESADDLASIPDWTIEHFLDDPKAAALRPRLNPKCNLYKGKWVYDNTYPLWTDYKHAFVKDRFNCGARKRNGTDYMKMRWQPDECNLPRFDAADIRKRLWGRRLVYVGDSLGRNMFFSMVGMLLHGANSTRVQEGLRETAEHWYPKFAYFFIEHNFTLEYYRSPLLSERRRAHKKYVANMKTILYPSQPSASWARPASSADIVVFNAGHWFDHSHTSKMGTYPEINGTVQLDPDWDDIFIQTMRSWAGWARQQRNAGRQIFFRGSSPRHDSPSAEEGVARTCPAEFPTWDPLPPPADPIEKRVKQLWPELGQPAEYLDVTALSAIRNDAHVGSLGDGPPDCSHWCFPGVPDTWNELLIATLLARGIPPFTSRYSANLDSSSVKQSSSQHK